MAQRSWYAPQRTLNDSREFVGLPIFERNIHSIAEMVHKDGGQLVLMTQGNLYKDEMSEAEMSRLYLANKNSVGDRSKWSHERAAAGMREYNQTMRDVAEQLDATLIDLDRIVPKDLDHFNDDVHIRAPTVDLIARTLANTVDTLLTNGTHENPTAVSNE